MMIVLLQGCTILRLYNTLNGDSSTSRLYNTLNDVSSRLYNTLNDDSSTSRLYNT
jgi:hypothetical protein